jgi:ADP-heptose:LPS heptosyltransferase
LTTIVLPENARILIIRRDNIGDLVCTTPFIRALRKRYPAARIDALVNSYCEPVLAHNPDLDHVYAYKKVKHRDSGESLLGIYWRRLKLMTALRRTRYDVAVIASARQMARPIALARQVGASHIFGFVEDSKPGGEAIDWPVPYVESVGKHFVEELATLARALDAGDDMPPARLVPSPAARQAALNMLPQTHSGEGSLLLGIHISSRKPQQRWPTASFVALMHELRRRHGASFMLFWSPGDEHNPLHPGDDRKAAEIIATTGDLQVVPYPTLALEALIGGLSVCDAMICSDGGAMHVAAALNKPIICFFGNSDATIWRPWGVPYRLLQKESLEVADIAIEEVLLAFAALLPFIVPGNGRRQASRE